MHLYYSVSRDPFFHLALEDWLLDHGDDIAPALIFSVNQPCVIVGKNQVPWRECATAALRADGVPVARRMSGGGTVYHDEGNLNYSLILPREFYRSEEVFTLLQAAFATLDIKAEVGPHNGLFCDGRKFSGSAFCYRRGYVLHHGTLLVAADLDRLRRYCEPSLPALETKAIPSRPASVLNLRELKPSLVNENIAEAITLAFIPELGQPRPLFYERQSVLDRAAAIGTWDWIWGHGPAFEAVFGETRFRIENGRIVGAQDERFNNMPFVRDYLVSTAASCGLDFAATLPEF